MGVCHLINIYHINIMIFTIIHYNRDLFNDDDISTLKNYSYKKTNKLEQINDSSKLEPNKRIGGNK
jgi:hypothetical protein